MENVKVQGHCKYLISNSTDFVNEIYEYEKNVNSGILIWCICWIFLYHATDAHKYLIVYMSLPIFILLTILFYILKIFVNIYLKLKHKSQFRGMLVSSDAVWATEDISKSIINVVLTVETSNGANIFIEDFKRTLQKSYFDNSETYPKLTSTLETFLGYNFLLKSNFNANDCISVYDFDEKFSSDGVEIFLGDYSKHNLPRNNRILWEMVFLKTNNQEIYVLIRISHIIGDGYSLINLFVHTFAEQKNYFTVAIPKSEEHFFSRSLKTVKILLMAPAILFYQNILRRKDENILHPLKLTGKRIFLSISEDYEEKLIDSVKRMKRKIPDSTFLDILLTAFSASFDTFFKMKCSRIPSYVTSVVPALRTIPNNRTPELKNLFSVALLSIPVFIKSNSLLLRLNQVKKEVYLLRHSIDYQVNSLLVSNFCGLIPSPILNYLLNMDTFTMTLSNVPGMPKVTILDGNLVNNVVFFTPQRGTAGVGFTILTYDNRFQLGMCVDEAIISSRDECKHMLIDIFYNIKRLEKEVFRL